MDIILGIVLMVVMLSVFYILGSLITAVILHALAMKSNGDEKKFFNMWINSIYYVTAIVLVISYFLPSHFSTFLYVTAILSYWQQIDLLGDEEKTDKFLVTIFKS